MTGRYELKTLPSFKDERGILCVLENFLPFEVKRTYWINSEKNQIRGGHRHKKTRQALVVVQGNVTISVDDSIHQKKVNLFQPNQLLIIEPEDWHEIYFNEKSCVLVFASEEYQEQDYIFESYR